MADNKELTTLIVRFIGQTQNLQTSVRRVENELTGLEKKVKSVTARVGTYFAGAFTAIAAVTALKRATKAAIEFGDAMDEVSTLLPTDADMRPLVEGALESAKAFGSGPAEQAKAYYQIISAGASSATEATETLNAANKLAVGGVTDVKTAADGLTSILNAYGAAAGTATDVSDAMFVAMRAGKTTIGELSQSIGNVAPLASEAGVALDDLLAATAALTKGGLTTSIAMNAIRGALTAVLKQSPAAVKEAEKLGIQFNVAAIKAKGLSGFLADVAEKTGGSVETLGALFGRVEGLQAVLALGGKQAEAYSEILADMALKAGATEEAFTKMSESAGFKLNQLKAAVTVLAIEVGEKLLKAIVPVAEAIVKNFDEIIAVIKTITVIIISRLVTALVLATARFYTVLRAATALATGLQAVAGTASRASIAVTAAGVAARGTSAVFGLLGGPLGVLITLLTVAATAWISFGNEAEEAGRKAQEALDASVKSIRDQATGLKALEAAYQRRWQIERETNELEAERKRLLDDSTEATEALMDATGDGGLVAARRLEQVNARLEELGQQADENNERLDEAVAKYKEVGDAADDLAKKVKVTPVTVDPEVLAAQAKANLKIIELQRQEEIELLKASYKEGEIDLTEYFVRRQEIIKEKYAQERAVLIAEQKQAETTPVRQVEIAVELKASEIKERRENAKVIAEETRAVQLYNAEVVKGEKQAALLSIKKQLEETNVLYEQGRITVEEYYTEKRRLSREATNAELEDLTRQLAQTENLIEQRKILNQISQVQLTAKITDVTTRAAEDVDRAAVLREAEDINAEFLALRQERAIGEMGILEAQHEAERNMLDLRYDDELARIAQLNDDKILLAGDYYTKDEALAKVSGERKIAAEQLLSEQYRQVQLARLNQASQIVGGLGQIFSSLYEATGKKSKELFYAQKALSIAQAIINTAEGVTKALAQGGLFGPALAGIITAAGAAQIALIISQKPPEFWRGGLITEGAGGRDDVNIRAARGEFVQPARAVQYYGVRAMEAIRTMTVPREILEDFNKHYYSQLAARMPHGFYHTGGLVAGGAGGDLTINVPVNVEGDPRLASDLRQGIETTVVRILKDHHR